MYRLNNQISLLWHLQEKKAVMLRKSTHLNDELRQQGIKTLTILSHDKKMRNDPLSCRRKQARRHCMTKDLIAKT